jgi:hypothetical protein
MNHKAAKDIAAMQMKQMFGVSNGQVTQYPPEKATTIYPPIDGSHSYIYKQAATDVLKATGVMIDPKNITLKPMLATAQAWQANQDGKPMPIPYQVLYTYKDANGIPKYDVLTNKRGQPMPWRVNPEEVEQWATLSSNERKRALEERQRAPEVRKQQGIEEGNKSAPIEMLDQMNRRIGVE